MKILDHFGNEIEVGDTLYCILKGQTYKVCEISSSICGQNRILSMENDFNTEDKGHYIVFKDDPYIKNFFLDVTKKDKEGAMKYHLLNSQIDGGS